VQEKHQVYLPIWAMARRIARRAVDDRIRSSLRRRRESSPTSKVKTLRFRFP
jgi:hypothetical protein